MDINKHVDKVVHHGNQIMEYIKNNVQKPVIAFIAGKTAKEGKTMGHAGAIVQGDVGTAEGKIKALSEAGAKIADKLSDIPNLLK